MPYPVRGEDRERDQRGAMRDEEHGYQDPRDQRGRDTWRPERTDERSDRRIDQRFDYGAEDRMGDRGWSNTSDQFAERDRDRSMSENRPYDRGDRSRQRNDNYGNYGNYGNRSFDEGRMRGSDEPGRGGYRDQEPFSRDRNWTDRSDRSFGRSFNDNDEGMYGQRGYGQGGSYSGQGGSYSGQGGSYSGQGGQSGSQAGDMSSRMRGQHHGKGPSGFQRSDERIKEMVSEALSDHDDIDATNIEVTVKGGEVTLTGTVDDRRTKRLTEECVEAVRGVRDVQNQLRVSTERKAGSSTTGGVSMTDKTDKTDQADKKHRPS